MARIPTRRMPAERPMRIPVADVYKRQPDELTYEQRMEFNRNSVVKKALLESLRLTGKEEAGDWEAEVRCV